MKIQFISILLLFCLLQDAYGQTNKKRTLPELINREEPGWGLVLDWIKEAKNKVEVLPKDIERAKKELLESQVTTRSPMGAIIYETGGILVEDGWIRILGSGSQRLNRGLMEWNLKKSYDQPGERSSFLLIADDAIGGFFAINAGEFGQADVGKVFYVSPDELEWESLGIGYSDFISFCFSGNLDKFYDGLRWVDWRQEVKELDGNKGFYFFPYLFTSEGKDINKVSRRAVPIQELWGLYGGKE